MIDKRIISYTRSILKSNPGLREVLGNFEVFYQKAGKEPKYNFITLGAERSKHNDPVQDGILYIDVYCVNNNDHEKLIEAANVIESLLDECVFPGGGALRTYLRDLEFSEDITKQLISANLMFSFRGMNF